MTTAQLPDTAEPTEHRPPTTSTTTIATTTGSTVHLADVSLQTSDGAVLLDQVNLMANPGELVSIVGASGSGKSTMLNVLSGNTAPTSGRATIDDTDASQLTASQRRSFGFVPQDDVLHEDLPLLRMCEYAAALRLPRGTSRREAKAAARQAISHVGLDDAASTAIKKLSGGQRKRASIAIELVTNPRACLLDEPTSGLDPTTADTVVSQLRALADSGRTVIFVTHNPNDLRQCDRIVALAPGGRVTFDGAPSEAIELAGTTDVDQVHRMLTSRSAQSFEAPSEALEATPRAIEGATQPTTSAPYRPEGDPPAPSWLRQWAALTTQTLETVARNRLTLAIMLGSPAMVIAMFAILFRPGAFEPTSPSPTSAIMIAFWVAFGGFFFGLTFGLLQICPEVPIMQRERRGGVSPGLQLLAKLTAIGPVLVLIDLAMLAVLNRLDRLPSLDLETYGQLAITLSLDAIAALALGLLASSLVRTPAQASLALPMLCFPAVLFSGAVLPVPVMAPVGRVISAAMPDRWAFEAIGQDLGLRYLFANDPSPLGGALLDEYGSTWTLDHSTVWIILAGFTVALSLAAWAALARRCAPAGGIGTSVPS